MWPVPTKGDISGFFNILSYIYGLKGHWISFILIPNLLLYVNISFFYDTYYHLELVRQKTRVLRKGVLKFMYLKMSKLRSNQSRNIYIYIPIERAFNYPFSGIYNIIL